VNYQWFAVRCCCTPQKVFGFIRLRPGLNEYIVLEKPKRKTTLRALSDLETGLLPRTHRIKVKTLDSYDTSELAIYSEDRPIEFWRNIEGFVEAK